MATEFSLLKVRVDRGVVFASIDNPPVNLITRELFRELRQLAVMMEGDQELKVLVLTSADPDIFISHFDVRLLQASAEAAPPPRDRANPFNELCERFRNMDRICIALIAGRVGGGGSELALSFDMRFGVTGRAVLNHMEVALGIIPGGGGTQRLPRLVGPSRALEIIAGGQDIDAVTAERWGFFNRVLSPDEADAFVSRLALRIAAWPAEAVRAAKRAIAMSTREIEAGLTAEQALFQRLLHSEDARSSIARFLEIGGQTRPVELNIADLGR